MGDGVVSRSRPGDRERVVNAPDPAALATRLIAQLADRPFRPSDTQLASAWGPALAQNETLPTRVRIAAGRYAGLFTDHVVEGGAIEGDPGEYVTVWRCARQAFIESMTAALPAQPVRKL